MERIDRAVERAGPDEAAPPLEDTLQPVAHTDHSRLHVVISHLHEILTTAPFVCLITDADGVIEYVNPRFEEAIGYSRAEVTGEKIVRISNDPAVNDEAWRALSKGEGWRGEITYSRRDGSEYCAMASIQPLRSSSGKVVFYFGLQIELTAQKRMEQQLAEREAKWRALAENAPAFITTIDRDGILTSINRDIYGGEVEQRQGRSVYDFVDERYHESLKNAMDAVFATGETVSLESQASTTSGEVLWFSSTIGPVWDGDRVDQAVVIAIDVTERKRAEEKLAAVATAVPDLIVVVDGKGVLREVFGGENRRGLLGAVPEVLRGQRMQDLLAPGEARAALAFVRATIRGDNPDDAEFQFALPAGKVWLHGRSAPMTLSDGVAVAVVHVSDITKRKLMEHELAVLREEVESLAEERHARAAEFGLTFREQTVLGFIARGCSDKEIAELLGVSPFTVNKQSASATRKLGARSRSEAVARAVRSGII